MIVDGRNTSLWHDLWLGEIPLLNWSEAAQYINLPREDTLSLLIDSNNYNSIVLDLLELELKQRALQLNHCLKKTTLFGT